VFGKLDALTTRESHGLRRLLNCTALFPFGNEFGLDRRRNSANAVKGDEMRVLTLRSRILTSIQGRAPDTALLNRRQCVRPPEGVHYTWKSTSADDRMGFPHRPTTIQRRAQRPRRPVTAKKDQPHGHLCHWKLLFRFKIMPRRLSANLFLSRTRYAARLMLL
jgi:hypothetical protein